ncbi:MAG: MaoC family dehydratase [Panacagrimonas sp.]
MTQILSRLPPTRSLYLKAAKTFSRKPGDDPVLPARATRIASLRVDPKKLSAYRDICGFPDNGTLPITYPQVFITPLQFWMMLQPGFPLPLMGLVHVRNRFEQQRPLADDEALDYTVSMGDSRRTHQGLEFDLITQVDDRQGNTVYRACMTPLYRMKTGLPRPPRAPVGVSGACEYRSFDIPESTGRRYASVSGDYNPIHLHRATARLFGFPRAIAHGMWSLARCVGAMEQTMEQTPQTLEVQFKQPVLLPARTSLRFQRQDDAADFALLSRDSDKQHLSGTLRFMADD